jgi:hypothetical protein
MVIKIVTETLTEPPGFIPVQSNLHQGHIVKNFGLTASEAHCKLQCILDPDDHCHFAVYVASQARCWIGNFLASVSKIGVSNSGIETGWIYYQSTQDELYFTNEIENTVWPPKISRPVANVPNRETCSAMCNLIEGANCQLFVYRPDTSDCLLGEYNTATNNIATTAGEFEMVSIRDGNLSEMIMNSKGLLSEGGPGEGGGMHSKPTEQGTVE